MAIRLYEWNAALAGSLYGITQALEIAVRNSMHTSLTREFRRGDWYEVCPLYTEQKETLTAARSKLTRERKIETPGAVVASLTFGFWTALVGPRYAQTLWDRCIKHAFTKGVKRNNVSSRLTHIRLLRNRIAHYESIIGKHDKPRDLVKDVDLIIEAIGWICPITQLWASQRDGFVELFGAKPQIQ